MINLRRRMIWLALFPLLAGALVACSGGSSIEVSMVETSRPGKWEAGYRTFDGVKQNTIPAEADETLVLDYRVEVDTGTLTLRLESPDGEDLLELTWEEDTADTVEVPLAQDGDYAIILEGDATGGSFDLSWELE